MRNSPRATGGNSLYKGVQSSSETGNLKLGGITPMMVAALPLIWDALSEVVGVGIEFTAHFFATKDRALRGPGLVVGGSKTPPDPGRAPDDPKNFFGYETAGITLRIIFVSDIDSRSAEIA